MKKLLFYVVLLVFGSAGVAGATGFCQPPLCEPPAQYHIWSDGQEYTTPIELNRYENHLFHFDITTASPSPYDPTEDELYFAWLVFDFYGENNTHYLGKYSFPGGGLPRWEWVWTNDSGEDLNEPELLWGEPLNDLRATGILDVDLKNVSWACLMGETFSVGAAYLFAKGCETNPVPEPATMLLLGSGLVVIAGVGRKKILKKRRPKKS
jgi:hypothetical protein